MIALILAAGKGTRMKSDLPKGLHEVCGLPIVELVARAVRGAGVDRILFVVGHGGELIVDRMGANYEYAWQREQLGTGHAVQMAADHLRNASGTVLITPGDTPLLTAAALRGLVEHHEAAGASCTVASIELPDPTGYGRVLRNSDGSVARIVEHKDATDAERAVKEVAVSVYCFAAESLTAYLPKLSNQNAQKEYYLTDLVELMAGDGLKVSGFVSADLESFLGVNDRWQLAEAERILNQRKLRELALSGVSIRDVSTTFIGQDVTVGVDTIILPMTIITGKTTIGSRCEIGPSTKIDECVIGDECEVLMSHLRKASLGSGVRCGPFANLRPGAELGEATKVGNFVEIKNASVGAGTSIAHLSYIGDATVGMKANIGAGTIFCNYDGVKKHRTAVGDRAFVGSNSTLVAPITIGDGAIIAAGSVITVSVPENGLGIGRQHQVNKEQWADQWRKRKAQRETS